MDAGDEQYGTEISGNGSGGTPGWSVPALGLDRLYAGAAVAIIGEGYAVKA